MLGPALALVFAVSVAAESPPHDHNHDAKSSNQANPQMDGGMSMQMHENMQKMQEQMAQLNKTTDPQERERLMQEHMQSMQKMMQMMQGMIGSGMMMGSERNQPAPKDGAATADRMQKMEQRMNMMQMMMQQMMQQQEQMMRSQKR